MGEKGRYISRQEREAVIVTDALMGTVKDQVLPHVDKMGRDTAKRIRLATTNLKVALEQYAEELSDDDKARLVKMNQRTRIVLTSDAYKPKHDDDREKMDVVHTLATFAIGNHCSGCTKDGETCELKRALSMADVPYVTTEPVNCPYEQ